MDKQTISNFSWKLPGFFRTSIYILAFISMLSSCAPSRNSYYFKTLQKDTTITGLVNKDLESKIIKGDNLSIDITSLSRDEDLLYNTSVAGVGTSTSGFQVDDQGFILVHKIGKIKAEGLTRKELASRLQQELLPYLKDPIVIVQYLNHKITILGEVVKPQVLNMPEEQVSLIDALVLSGDVTDKAKRSDIMIIREAGNEKKVKHVNLENHSIFSSPWYYVQPNDIVVVMPDFEKTDKEAKRARFQTNFSILLSAVSLVLIIVDRVFR